MHTVTKSVPYVLFVLASVVLLLSFSACKKDERPLTKAEMLQMIEDADSGLTPEEEKFWSAVHRAAPDVDYVTSDMRWFDWTYVPNHAYGGKPPKSILEEAIDKQDPRKYAEVINRAKLEIP